MRGRNIPVWMRNNLSGIFLVQLPGEPAWPARLGSVAEMEAFPLASSVPAGCKEVFVHLFADESVAWVRAAQLLQLDAKETVQSLLKVRRSARVSFASAHS